MRPRVILLDLNMPLIDGRPAPREIKAHPISASNPFVVPNASHAESDVFASYRMGVSSIIVKPSTFEDLVEITQLFNHSWYGVVKSPLS